MTDCVQGVFPRWPCRWRESLKILHFSETGIAVLANFLLFWILYLPLYLALGRLARRTDISALTPQSEYLLA